MSDSANVVLSALLTHDVVLIDEISHHLAESHFVDPTLRSLYRAILVFRSVAGGVLTLSAVEDIVKDTDAGTAALIVETYNALLLRSSTVEEARWSVSILRKDRELYLTQTALRDSQEILSGKVTEEGTGRVWAGSSDAREWLSLRLAEISLETTRQDSPSGDIFQEKDDILSSYDKAKNEDRSRRPHSGVPSLDEVTGGAGPGELIIVAAPSGVGKSHWCVHQAYHAAVYQGLSVHFATSETVRATVRTRLVSRHSRHEKFAEVRDYLELPFGLNSNSITHGSLSDDEHKFFEVVVKDFEAIEGSVWVDQIPRGCTVEALAASMDVRHRMRRTDLAIMDYLFLLSGSRRYHQKREELVSILVDSKHLCVDFDKGNGVPLISPWQFSRTAKKEMEQTGDFELDGLSETAEAANSADMVMYIAADGVREPRFLSAKIGVLKNRDGEVLMGGNSIPVRIDYATSHFAQRLSSDASSWSSNGHVGEESVLLSLLS